MFNIATISNVATSLVGTAFVGIAALSVTTQTAHAAPAGFTRSVEASIGRNFRMPTLDRSGVATVAVQIDANGHVVSADIAKSSGVASFDREAIRTAKAVAYPATGANRTVAMVLGFNQAVSPAVAKQATAHFTDHRLMLANQTTAQPIG